MQAVGAPQRAKLDGFGEIYWPVAYGPGFQPSQRYRLLTWADGPGWNRDGPLALLGGWDSSSLVKAFGLWWTGRAFGRCTPIDFPPGPLAPGWNRCGPLALRRGCFLQKRGRDPSNDLGLVPHWRDVPPIDGYRCYSRSVGCTRIVWLERDALFRICTGMRVRCIVPIYMLHSGAGFAGAFEELAGQRRLIRRQPCGSHRQRRRGRG